MGLHLQFVYTKCSKSDINSHHPNLGSTGGLPWSEYVFYENPDDERLLNALREEDVIVKIDRLKLTYPEFSSSGEGMWKNLKAINMAAVSVVEK